MSGFVYPVVVSTPPTVVSRILSSGSQSLVMLANTRIQNYRAFWADPVKNAADLGINATAVFIADADTAEFLGKRLTAAGAPQSVIDAATAGVPTGWHVEYHENGSIAISPVGS